MKSTVRILRSAIYSPLAFLHWFGVPITVLRHVASVIVGMDKPLRKYLSGGQP